MGVLSLNNLVMFFIPVTRSSGLVVSNDTNDTNDTNGGANTDFFLDPQINMSEWWLMIGGPALQAKIEEMPEDIYMKYWLGKGLLDPWRDESACMVIVEFFNEVDQEWVAEYFEYPVAAAINCRCKAINSVAYLEDFECRGEKGQSMVSQIQEITETGFFPAKACCQDFIETDSE